MKNSLRRQGLSKLWIYDYIVFSQPRECWDPEHEAEVASGIEDIELAHRFLNNQGIQLHVIYVPAAWVFAGENLEGKKSEQFRLAAKTVVGSQGLAQTLAAELHARAIPFLDVERELNTYKRNAGNAMLYFPVDGHWNSQGQAVIAIIIFDRFLSGDVVRNRRAAQ